MALQERHQLGINLFRQGQYEEAAAIFSEILLVQPNSELWNDWAVARAASGHTMEAKHALELALRLDPANREAQTNLKQLLQAASRNTKFYEIEFQKSAANLGSQSPDLSQEMAWALGKPGDSEYFARGLYGELSKISAGNIPCALSALEHLATQDTKYSGVLALWHMGHTQYDSALTLLHAAFDVRPSDLFLERLIIECERQRHEINPATTDSFVGVEAYLQKSFCEVPWKHMEIGVDDAVYMCCPAWLPLPMGKAGGQTAEKVWNSGPAREVRKSILDGSFKYCSKIHCPLIAGRSLPSREEAPSRFPELFSPVVGTQSSELDGFVPHGPEKLVLSYDRTCNLACPQCRSGFYSADKITQDRMESEYEPFILEAAKDAKTLYLDGSGEVFASKHSRKILAQMTRQRFPNLKFHIISNGQVFDCRAWDTFDLRDRIERIDISIDAAQAATYKVVRLGGNFERLMRNLDFLDGLRMREGQSFSLRLNYVVSSLNFREIPQFVPIARRFHADSILFTIIRNWGHFTKQEFDKLNIASPLHPDHLEFKKILQSPQLTDPIVELGSIRPYRT